MLPQQGSWVQSLVGKLRSCMPQGKKINKNWFKKIYDEPKIKIKKKIVCGDKHSDPGFPEGVMNWYRHKKQGKHPGGGADRSVLGRSKPRGGVGVESHLGKDRMGKSGQSAEGRVQDRDQNLNDVEITPVAIKMGVKNTNKELSFANKRFWQQLQSFHTSNLRAPNSLNGLSGSRFPSQFQLCHVLVFHGKPFLPMFISSLFLVPCCSARKTRYAQWRVSLVWSLDILSDHKDRSEML